MQSSRLFARSHMEQNLLGCSAKLILGVLQRAERLA